MAVRAIPFHKGVMVLSLLAFGAQKSSPRAAMIAGARINSAILGGQWHRLVSPVFLHGGAMHLFSNLFSLWRVGPLVEAAYGPARTAVLYLLSGVGGNLAGLWFSSNPRGMSIGASGAVFGMMGAVVGYVGRNSRALGSYGTMLLQNVGTTLLLNLYIGTRRGSGIDNLAHAGGFVAGALLGVLLAPEVGRGRAVTDRSLGVPADADADGAMLPPWAVRGLLAATVTVYAVGLREAAKIATVFTRIYGRV